MLHPRTRTHRKSDCGPLTHPPDRHYGTGHAHGARPRPSIPLPRHPRPLVPFLILTRPSRQNSRVRFVSCSFTSPSRRPANTYARLRSFFLQPTLLTLLIRHFVLNVCRGPWITVCSVHSVGKIFLDLPTFKNTRTTKYYFPFVSLTSLACPQPLTLRQSSRCLRMPIKVAVRP